MNNGSQIIDVQRRIQRVVPGIAEGIVGDDGAGEISAAGGLEGGDRPVVNMADGGAELV